MNPTCDRPDAAELRPRLAGELPGFTTDFGWFAADLASNFFQRHIHEALGPQGDVAAFAATLDAGIARHLRDDIGVHVKRIRRDARTLDALTAFTWLLPPDDPAQSAWSRHAETQHLRQFGGAPIPPLRLPLIAPAFSFP